MMILKCFSLQKNAKEETHAPPLVKQNRVLLSWLPKREH